MRTLSTMLAVSLAVLCASPRAADAFCGFYVSGADAQLFNNATQVALMREGTRTVLSMQNNYQGPPSDFAMVVPVPIVLQKDNVKTLPQGLFARLDQLDAPRLVEYWEQDPCSPPEEERDTKSSVRGALDEEGAAAPTKNRHGVKIEAQFTVGEYEIVILSAQDSTGLDAWLRDNKYKIPAGAEPVLRPYVQSGMKFFVAKVDAKKVAFKDGMAMLSPLRFHYDSDTFSLPVRLGLLSSAGVQDLIVHVLAPRKRYEAANYPNITIPTNLDVAEAAREQFGSFYAALFDRTLQAKPGAVITEYSWESSSCDPCPTPPLTPDEISVLGGDVLPAARLSGDDEEMIMPGRGGRYGGSGFVLTRLHARYTKESLGEDLVFREASAIQGGRESMGPDGKLENGAAPAGANNFQGRYAIRHPWAGPIACEHPRRGIWGGPPRGAQIAGEGDNEAKAAQNLAFVTRGMSLSAFVAVDVPEIGFKAGDDTSSARLGPGASGCGACVVSLGAQGDAGDDARGGSNSTGGALAAGLGALGALAALVRRRGRSRSAIAG